LAASGAWTAFYYWPILPTLLWLVVASLASGNASTWGSILITVIVGVLFLLGVHFFQMVSRLSGGLSGSSSLVLRCFSFIGYAVRKAWMGRGDLRNCFCHGSRSTSDQDSVLRASKQFFRKLRTDEGVRLLLHEVGKSGSFREYRRSPSFLMFLDSRLRAL